MKNSLQTMKKNENCNNFITKYMFRDEKPMMLLIFQGYFFSRAKLSQFSLDLQEIITYIFSTFIFQSYKFSSSFFNSYYYIL